MIGVYFLLIANSAPRYALSARSSCLCLRINNDIHKKFRPRIKNYSREKMKGERANHPRGRKDERPWERGWRIQKPREANKVVHVDKIRVTGLVTPLVIHK